MLPLFFQVVMDKVLFHQGMKTLDILILALLATGIYEICPTGIQKSSKYFFPNHLFDLKTDYQVKKLTVDLRVLRS